ncbi:MAG TPA: transporter associated domain-containing protein [Burkholderiales bacterium]
MEWLTDPTIWVGFATLVVLEVVLAIDNLIFIAILADRLPPQQRDRARIIGLSLALVMRLGLLASISWVMSLTAPLFSVLAAEISWRDLILIVGGLFLLVKATTEIHDRVESQGAGHAQAGARAAFWPVVAQIVVLDAVFSLDSVITAIGMVDELAVMMAAVVVAVALMLVASKPLTAFVNRHPSLVILCLGFLLMVGLMLVVDGFGVHVPKGYLYAAIGFSVLIEILNQLAARNRVKWAAALPPRQRAAHAVLRLLGGVPVSGPGELALETPAGRPVFQPVERRMVRGVLDLAHRPVTAIMTPRRAVAWLDARAATDEILEKVRLSPYREFPVGRGSVDEMVGVARKEDILSRCLEGKPIDLAASVREPLAIPESASVLSALEHFKRTPAELAIVVDEYGAFQGLVTRTDLLEAIAGDLPEAAGEQPGLRKLNEGAYAIEGDTALADLQEQLGLAELPEGDYATAAGLALALLGAMPRRGDGADWGGWRFEVAELDGLRISRLLARRQPPEESA